MLSLPTFAAGIDQLAASSRKFMVTSIPSRLVLAHPMPIIQYVVTGLRLASAAYAHVGYDGPVAGWMYFRMSPAPQAPPVDLVTDDFWQHLGRDALYSPVPFPIRVPPVVGESAHDPVHSLGRSLSASCMPSMYHWFPTSMGIAQPSQISHPLPTRASEKDETDPSVHGATNAD